MICVLSGESASALITQLIQLQLPTRSQGRPGKSWTSLIGGGNNQRLLERKLRKIIYEVLIFHPNPPDDSDLNISASNLSEVDQLLVFVYVLRCHRQFDEANQLEDCLNRLKATCLLENGCVRAVLRLLLLLSKPSSPCQTFTVAKTSTKLNVSAIETCHPIFPVGPLNYGDTWIHQPRRYSSFYMHYPRDVFEWPTEELVTNCGTYCHVDAKLFEMTPGTSRALTTLSLPDKKKSKDSYTHELSKTLYGALSHRLSEPCDIHVRLELPDLVETSSHSLSQLRCRKTSSKSQSSEDEGFTEPDTPMSASMPLFVQEQDIWEIALSVSPKTHYTWESIGSIVVPKEKSYLSEAGCVALDEIGMMSLQELHILHPTRTIPAFHKVTTEELLRNITYVMVGIQSNSFQFIEAEFRFCVRENLLLSGTTPYALKALLQEFADCGTDFSRLSRFSVEPNVRNSYNSGLVFRAFAEGLRRTLHFHHAMVLAVRPRSTLLQLLMGTSKIRSQIRALSELCLCPCHRPFWPNKIQFPMGIQLLSYLYTFTLEAVGSELYTVMLSLLRTSCAPYLRFLHEWMYEGVCHDVYGEFPIVANSEHLICRDHCYWSKGFSMTSVTPHHSVPLFLSDLAKDMFVCGKSLDLLKLCFPQHHLFKGDEGRPALRLTFSASQLNSVESQSEAYLAHMESIALKNQMTWEQKEQRVAEEKTTRQEMVQKEAARNMERLQKNIQDAKLALEEKKRIHMAELQEQIRLVRERKKSEREKQEADEKAMQTKLEEQIAEDKRQAKLALEKKYADMNEDLHRQEQHLEWRTQRLQLYAERRVLLQREEEEYAETLGGNQPKSLLESKAVAMETSPDSVFSEVRMEESPDSSEISPLPEVALEDIELVLRQTDDNQLQENDIVEENVAIKNITNTELDGRRHRDTITGPLNQNEDRNANVITRSQTIEDLGQVERHQDLLPEDSTEQPSVGEPCMVTGAKRKRGGDDGTAIQYNPQKVKSRRVRVTETKEMDFKVNERLSSGGDRTAAGKRKSSNTFSASNNNSGIPIKKSEAQTHIVLEHEVVGALPLRSVEPVSVSSPQTARNSVQSKAKKESVVSLPGVARKKSSIKQLTAEIAAKSMPVALASVPESLSIVGVNKLLQSRGSSEFGHSSDSSLQLLLYSGDVESSSSLTIPKKKMLYSSVSLVERPLAPVACNLVEHHSSMALRPRRRNVHGHASDSTIEKVLYGEKQKLSDAKTDSVSELSSIISETTSIYCPIIHPAVFPVKRYEVDVSQIVGNHLVDVMTTVINQHEGKQDESHDSVHEYLPLSVIIQRSLSTPLLTQINLVNKSITDYFLVELGIQQHLEALRSFLLLHDGEFAQVLADVTFDRLAMGITPAELLNPVSLNCILTKAFNASLSADDPITENFSFVIRSIPKAFSSCAPSTPFSCLDLHYKPQWPVNIIVTSSSLAKYNEIFHFQMRIRHTLWALTDVFFYLKRNIHPVKGTYSPQFNQLQLYRHDMHHFVRVMQAYVASQVLQAAWKDLETDIANRVRSLDDLHAVHETYLNRALHRSLLTNKALPIMKMINRILLTILKFRVELVTCPWHTNKQTGLLEHRAYKTLCSSYKMFREYSSCLYKEDQLKKDLMLGLCWSAFSDLQNGLTLTAQAGAAATYARQAVLAQNMAQQQVSYLFGRTSGLSDGSGASSFSFVLKKCSDQGALHFSKEFLLGWNFNRCLTEQPTERKNVPKIPRPPVGVAKAKEG